jgi:predicted nucleic acid-binding protein
MKLLLDANILFHTSLRTLFLHLHEEGFFQVHLSFRIINEWKINYSKIHKGKPIETIFKTLDDFVLKYPDVLISNYEDLALDVKLFDMNDHHLLQAAIKCDAQFIITYNIKDFPRSRLRPCGIEAINPKNFFKKFKSEPSLEIFVNAYAELYINTRDELEAFKSLNINLFDNYDIRV